MLMILFLFDCSVFFVIFYDFYARLRMFFFFFQAEDGIRDLIVTGVQTCALPILHAFAPGQLATGEVIVDALLGTGLKGVVQAQLAEVIRAINSSGRPVFALDVPWGLDGDAGVPLGEAVRADATVTFVGLKTGLLVGEGPEFAGTVFFDDLEVSPAPAAQLVPRLTRIIEAEIHAALPRRTRSANKGNFGRVLIVGSGSGMPGAARLAGEACLGVGAGLTTVAVAPENVAPIAAGRPELICVALSDEAVLAEVLTRADVIAVGPGLGRSPWARAALDTVLASGKPLVIDADALNLLAGSGAPAREDWILTPHPGEAGRLLGLSAQDIQRDRLAALDRLIERFHGTIVLKGAGTLVGARRRAPRTAAPRDRARGRPYPGGGAPPPPRRLPSARGSAPGAPPSRATPASARPALSRTRPCSSGPRSPSPRPKAPPRWCTRSG